MIINVTTSPQFFCWDCIGFNVVIQSIGSSIELYNTWHTFPGKLLFFLFHWFKHTSILHFKRISSLPAVLTITIKINLSKILVIFLVISVFSNLFIQRHFSSENTELGEYFSIFFKFKQSFYYWDFIYWKTLLLLHRKRTGIWFSLYALFPYC